MMGTDIVDDGQRLKMAVRLIAKLFILCNESHKNREKLFIKRKAVAGDYLGTGYDFVDAFERVYDDFTYNGDNILNYMVQSEIYNLTERGEQNDQ